jgi:hypothetical protein
VNTETSVADPDLFFSLPDPDPLVRGTDLDLAMAPDPDPYIVKQN